MYLRHSVDYRIQIVPKTQRTLPRPGTEKH